MLEDGFINYMFVVEDNISSEENLDSLDPIESSDDLDNSKTMLRKVTLKIFLIYLILVTGIH